MQREKFFTQERISSFPSRYPTTQVRIRLPWEADASVSCRKWRAFRFYLWQIRDRSVRRRTEDSGSERLQRSRAKETIRTVSLSCRKKLRQET